MQLFLRSRKICFILSDVQLGESASSQLVQRSGFVIRS